MLKKENPKKKNVLYVIGILLLCTIIFIFTYTYAINSKKLSDKIRTNVLQIDESAYGNTKFNSTNLKFNPILDNQVETSQDNTIHIDFNVGGSSDNEGEDIIYDIALVDLELDCELLSPYLKWKLIKNGTEISNGSLDYHFDTIEKGRLVLTNTQQDLKEYSEDKSTYDHYSFYLWISDSCQKDNIEDCTDNEEEQSNLMKKQLKGKIEVELYAKNKKTLVRNPSESLPTDTCIKSDNNSNEESSDSTNNENN